MSTALRRILFLILVIISWEAGYRIFDWGWKFPSVMQTFQAFYDGFVHGQLLEATFESLKRLLLAFIISIVIGTALGFLFARYRILDDTFGFLVVALQTIPSIYIKAAQTMGTGNGFNMFYQIMIPAAFPQLITGVRVAWAFAWRALVAGELIAKGIGLGQLLQDGRNLADTALMLCIVIIIAVLATISDHFVFKRMEDNLLLRYGLISQQK